MVKSGLDEDNVRRQQAARVSAYRLVAHLSSAVALYSALLYSGLSILSRPVNTNNGIFRRALRNGAWCVTGLLATTMLTGAFVAGLDAGMIYNTFPKIGNQWIPSDIWDEKKGMTNIVENPTTVQFSHRLMAMGTVSAITGYYLWARRYRAALPRRVRMALDAMLVASWSQGILGVLTLIHSVPVALGSAHQIGGMATLTTSLYMLNILRPI
jgi:heme a synthase